MKCPQCGWRVVESLTWAWCTHSLCDWHGPIEGDTVTGYQYQTEPCRVPLANMPVGDPCPKCGHALAIHRIWDAECAACLVLKIVRST